MWYWFFFLFPCVAWSAEVPTAHIAEEFVLKGDPETYERHVIFPVEEESRASLESRYWLHAVGGWIKDDAEGKGFLSGPSRRFYFDEIEKYKEGRWPCSFITRKGQWRVLAHLAYASRWDDSPLPWEARFLGDETGVLPTKISSESRVVLGGFRFPSQEITEGASREWMFSLGVMIPEIVGERTELKFLFGDEPSLIFVRELFAASLKYQLHRPSFRPTSDDDWEKFNKAVTTFNLETSIDEVLGAMSGSGRLQHNINLRDQLLGRELHRYVRNSTVFTHVSGIPHGPEQKTARGVLFGKKLQLPEPRWSFIESDSVGTAGIRTDIAAISVEEFESIVLRSLDRDPELSLRPAIYVEEGRQLKSRHCLGALLRVAVMPIP